MLRIPLLLLYNILRNMIRLVFLPFGLVARLFRGKGKPTYVRVVIEEELVRWRVPTWRDWFQDTPDDLTLEDWYELFEEMGKSDKVKGLVLEIKKFDASLTVVHELKELLNDFRKEGKEVVLLFHHSLTLGGMALAAGADRVLVQPSANVFLMAPSMQSLFFARMLRQIGVKMAMERVGKHKHGPEPLTKDYPSSVFREDMLALLDKTNEQLFPDLAEARSLTLEEVYECFAMGVFSFEEALSLKLLDGVRYADRLEEYIKEGEPTAFVYPEHPLAASVLERQEMLAKEASKSAEEDQGEEVAEGTQAPTEVQAEAPASGAAKGDGKEGDGKKDDGPALVDWDEVSFSPAPLFHWTPLRRPKMVGVIPMVGAIVDEASRTPGGGESVVRDQVLEAIEAARSNHRIKSVVAYINSRGGSATASEAIWWALKQLDGEKPVITFMDDYAASGGYYIACGSRKIIANPWCLTGSIGVFGGKPVVTELLQKLKLTVASIGETPASRFLSPLADPTDAERERLQQQMRLFYERFLLRVAENRGKTPEEIDPLAQGRVYLATDALAHGLVDQCAGFEETLKQARNLGGLKEDAPVRIFKTAPKLGPIGMLRSQMQGEEASSALSLLEPLLASMELSLADWLELHQVLRLLQKGGIAAWSDLRWK